MYLAKIDDLPRYPSPKLKESHASSLSNGTTNGQLEELPTAVDPGNQLLLPFYRFLAVFFRQKAQYCRAQQFMTQRTQSLDFSQCPEIALDFSSRENCARVSPKLSANCASLAKWPYVLALRFNSSNNGNQSSCIVG
jgi:hypothetical protein